MLKLENNALPKEFKLFIWFLMSFQAGYINVGGFLIFGNFVSHVTGTSSQIGMGVASSNWEQIMVFITVLSSFIFGAAFAGHFIGRKLLEGKEPQYVFVTGVKASLFAMVLIVSEYYFSSYNLSSKLILIFLLSLVCGIQNATCSLATNGFLKPTHMTGLSTDIGINFARVFGYAKASPEYKEERRKNFLRLGILSSFIVGGSVAYFIFSQNGHYGFLFPFVSSLCMLVTSVVSERPNPKKSLSLKLAQSSVLGVFVSTLIFSVVIMAQS
ncbi:MAG: DUF1275 domain-containing protein [Halobacteriovoraceae bacterium]|nr:DUF1275 domain-containing protein [Halobacteriovoraceae bacterium]MCB9095448.1 DUF1275 domain-containing protein [Halobacteriovoraceae bacterium]